MSEFSPQLKSALVHLTEVGEQTFDQLDQLSKDFIESHDGLSERVEAVEVVRATEEERFGLFHNRLGRVIHRMDTIEKPASPQHDKLYAALAVAQGDIQAAETNKKAEIRKKDDYSVVLYTFKYADLAACLDVIRKPLSDNGLALIQIPSLEGNAVNIRTVLGHESGQSVSCTMTMTPDKGGPQAIGTCMSYLRRYSLCAMLGVAQFDDDAQSTNADPDDYERISPEQIDEILVLADKHFKRDADAKVNRMLDKAFQVTIVGDIPAKLFDSAINLLNNQAKREKAQAKKPPTTESKDEPGADG